MAFREHKAARPPGRSPPAFCGAGGGAGGLRLADGADDAQLLAAGLHDHLLKAGRAGKVKCSGILVPGMRRPLTPGFPAFSPRQPAMMPTPCGSWKGALG